MQVGEEVGGGGIDLGLAPRIGRDEPRHDRIAEILQKEETLRVILGEKLRRGIAVCTQPAPHLCEAGGILATAGRRVHEDGAPAVERKTFVAPGRGIAGQHRACRPGPPRRCEEPFDDTAAISHLRAICPRRARTGPAPTAPMQS